MEELAEMEIGVEPALALVKEGKSIFVWMGGNTPTPLNELLGIDRSMVLDVDVYTLMEKETYPEELKAFEKPIFVCHHGITSYDVASFLPTIGKQGYSLAGGIEGLKKYPSKSHSSN